MAKVDQNRKQNSDRQRNGKSGIKIESKIATASAMAKVESKNNKYL
jgi:hypothetical protein